MRFRFLYAALAALSIGGASDATAQSQPLAFITGDDFLAMSQDHREAYVAGLADQLLGLYQAQLVDGFLWFETCAGNRPPAIMAQDLVEFLEEPARRPEPAANNFIWAVAKTCTE